MSGDSFFQAYLNFSSENQRIYGLLLERIAQSEDRFMQMFREVSGLENVSVPTPEPYSNGMSQGAPYAESTVNTSIERLFDDIATAPNQGLTPRNLIETMSQTALGNSVFSFNNLPPPTPEPTGLSPEQIQSSISEHSWGSLASEQGTCPITLQQFSDNDIVSRIDTCGHLFSRGSLRDWVSQSTCCPVCRRPITD